MKNYKKIISFLLVIAIVFLCGCTSSQNEEQTTTAPKKELVGFIEANIEPGYLQNASSLCIKDDLLVFMTSTYTDKDGNLYTPAGEDEAEGLDVTTYIVKYDLKDNKLIDKFELNDCPIKEVWGIELDNDKIVVFSDSEKKNAYYDLDMNFVEETDREVTDELQEAMKSSFYTSKSAARNGFCDFTGANYNQIIYFYDNPEVPYVFNADETYQPSEMNFNNGYILCETFGNSEENANFKVVDYKGAKEINDATIIAKDYGYDNITTGQTSIGDKYAVCVEYFGNSEDENNYTHKMFYWNYQNEPTNKALDIKNYTKFDAFNEQTIKEIKDKYNVDIYINEPCENIVDSVSCEEEPNKIMLYDNLNAIKFFFDSLPEGMVGEIYSGYKDKENEKSGIRIDLVSEITIDAGGFAKDFVDPMEACFPFNNVTMTNIAHEFMHLFEARLADYDSSYYENWDEFNKGFEHEYNPNEDEHYEYEFDEKQFLSDYSTKNNTEERAEIFAYLYTGGGPALENEVLRKKADYLIEIIKNAFPSVKNAESVCWAN